MAVVLEMDPEAHDMLVHLYKICPSLVARVDDWLDRIEADPWAGGLRRRLIRPGQIWAITIPDPGEGDFLILWDLDGDVPVIRYLGPDVLRANDGT